MDATILNQYDASFTREPSFVPTSKIPDGPLCGNGDIGIAATAEAKAGTADFYIGKNDIWNSKSVWETPGMRGYGLLRFACPQAAGHFFAKQKLNNAEIELTLSGERAELRICCQVLRGTNYIVNRLQCARGSCTVKWSFQHTSRDETEAYVREENGAIIAHKAYMSLEQDWPLIAHSITFPLGKAEREITLNAGESTVVATALYTNLDTACWQAACENAAADFTEESLATMCRSNDRWWEGFWKQSSLEIPSEPLLERYWYTSHYLMACCCESCKLAPGLFGNWLTTDIPAWGGDYHLNYNYEAPWWGLYSSNHIELCEPYDRPLLEYMPKAQKAARDKLGCRGLYTLVGIGPRGLRTAALTDKSGNDDINYWGQKSNAAYAAVNMAMRFYSTYDLQYARNTAYPYLRETALFWLDYLDYEDGRYVVHNDCIHENQAAAIGVFDWADETTLDASADCNPLITLGLLRVLFKCLLDICAECEIKDPDQKRWAHILEHLSSFPTMEREGQTVFRYTEAGTEWSGNNSLGIQHIYPAGCVGLGSAPELLRTARNTFVQMARWEDYNAFPTYYPAGARLGIAPEQLLDHLNQQLKEHGWENGFVFYGGGGLECCSTIPVTLNEMLLQSHEGVLRLFPVWNLQKDVCFCQLRAYGAFLVSAELKQGRIRKLEITSERGKDCRLWTPYPAEALVLCRGERIPARNEEGIFLFATQPGETYQIILD